MELRINDESFFYEAQQMLLLYFPDGGDVKMQCEIRYEDDKCFCYVHVLSYGKEGEYAESGSALSHRDVADTIKKTAYFALGKVSDKRLPWGILTGIRPAKPIRQMLESGANHEETLNFFCNNYYAEKEKVELALAIAESERRLLSPDGKSVSVYVGIPFCPTRCSYCSFISHDAGKMLKLSGDYVELLKEEMKITAQIINELGLYVRCIYFGGGTPTALSEGELSEVLYAAQKYFVSDKTAEFTVEAGRPDTVNPEKLRIIKNAGAGRISINPQTIHDCTLEKIGRKHTFSDFVHAFHMARENGFDNINCDTIAGLPGENEEMFKESIDYLTNLSPENITVHTLYLKRASTLKKQGFLAANDGGIEKMVSYAQSALPKNGYNPYYLYKQKATLGNLENVGFSKKGFECIYNIDTMSDESTVFALGAGGVSKIVLGDRIERVFNFKNADEYIKRFEEIKERKQSILKIITR